MQWNYNELSELRVLIVNTFPELRTIIRGVLGDIGIHETYGAEDSQRALDMIPELKPDIAIFDSQIAPVNGVSLTKYIRRDPNSPMPELPIVLVATFWGEELVFEARDAGASEIVAKPFSASALQKHVKAATEYRPTIASGDYVGPDRRRKVESFIGPDKRRIQMAA